MVVVRAPAGTGSAPIEPTVALVRTRAVKRWLVAVLAAVAALVVAAPAAAHPLGNFTINRYAGIEVAGNRIFVHYALDLAEIPSYQLGSEARTPRFAQRLGRDLVLTLDGRTAPLRVLERRVTTGAGAGGLETLRLDVVYAADGGGRRLAFQDRGFPGRIGWREVTLSARDGAEIVESSVPATSESAVLRRYPATQLRSPLDVSSALAAIRPGDRPGEPPTLDGSGPGAARGGGGFEALVERGELSLGALLVSLLVAAFWGAAHALTPGHGKALVAAYLVGTRGTPRHAFLLGGTVTIAHTAGVFGIGIVTLALSQFILPETLYPWLTLVSGLLVVAVGASVLRGRLRGRHHHHSHGHHHGHGHHDRHAHRGHEHPTSRGIVGVGLAAGLLPCPSALVVLLAAIALHRVGLGLALILAFSVGLAGTITAIGLVAVYARRAFGKLSLDGRLVRALPAASAALIVLVGVAITARALPGVV
jgi:ABC-type nickel/cobalt efflux system permease component RcnA